jgi:hypothetical protein
MAQGGVDETSVRSGFNVPVPLPVVWLSAAAAGPAAAISTPPARARPKRARRAVERLRVMCMVSLLL